MKTTQAAINFLTPVVPIHELLEEISKNIKSKAV
jgi:hypothetical protein